MSRKHTTTTASVQTPDTTLTPIFTGNAWLPTAPTGGTTGLVSTTTSTTTTSAPLDPTTPLNVTGDMFTDGVVDTAPDGTVQPVPTNLCATPAAAATLQGWLQANGVKTTIVYGAPEPANLQTDEYKFSTLVPWLEDGKGARENAGVLLSSMQYWGQISRSTMLSQTVGAFTADDAMEQTDPTNQGLAGNVPNEDSPTPAYPQTASNI